MNKNIDYERITSLLVESMENVMYGADSADGHEATQAEIELQIKKAESISNLAKSAMEVRNTEINEKRLNLDVVKTLIGEGYSMEDVNKSGLVNTHLIEDKK